MTSFVLIMKIIYHSETDLSVASDYAFLSAETCSGELLNLRMIGLD
jgi:hypothetical protein